MTRRITRRDFIKIGVVGGAAAMLPALAGCGAGGAQKSAGPTKLNYWGTASDIKIRLETIKPRADAYAAKNNLELNFVDVPYADFEAKYLSAFASRVNAPDMFIGVVSFWAGAADVADPMPDALAKRLETEVVDAVKPGYKMNGKWMGLSEGGIPGFGPMLIYNPDDFAEVGLDPKKPPTTMDELLEYSRKLVKRDATGNITRSGCAMRYDGALGLGVATKFFPFLHSFGGQMFDPTTGKSQGIANSAETVEAVAYVTKYTQDEKLASITLGVPDVQFGQRKASMFFREGHMAGWIPTNYPGVNFVFAPVPKARKVGMGLTGLSEWAPLVYKFGPNKAACWDFLDKVVYQADTELVVAQHPANQAVCSFKKNWETDYMKNRKDYAVEQYALTNGQGTTYMHAKTGKLADRFAQGVQESMLGKKKPKEAMDAAAADMETILKS